MKTNIIGSAPEVTIEVEGRLDTKTAPEFEKELQQIGNDVTKAVFDFSKLDYISSSGLRAVLNVLKTGQKVSRKVVIRGANPLIKDIFTTTGFDSIMDIE